MSNPNFGVFAARGGAASAKLQRDRSIENYLKNPQICEFCNEVIKPKRNSQVSQFRNDRYCSLKCSALGHWRGKRLREGLAEPRKFGPWINTLPFRTKKTANRGAVNQHARKVYFSKNPEPSCLHCGINDFDLIDVAHIKAISAFTDDTPLFEINNIDNLMGLCKNCHWLFDKHLPGKKGVKKNKKPQELPPEASVIPL